MILSYVILKFLAEEPRMDESKSSSVTSGSFTEEPEMEMNCSITSFGKTRCRFLDESSGLTRTWTDQEVAHPVADWERPRTPQTDKQLCFQQL